jgi:hypothetical protein
LSCRIPTLKGISFWFIAADFLTSFFLAILLLTDDAVDIITSLLPIPGGIPGDWNNKEGALISRTLQVVYVLYFVIIHAGQAILYYYVSNGFRFPLSKFAFLLVKVVIVLLLLLAVVILVGGIGEAAGLTEDLLIIAGWIYWSPAVLSVALGSSNHIHFPETLFPIFRVDRATDKMMRDDSSSKNVFYLIFLMVVYACVQKIIFGKSDTNVPQLIYFCSMCLVSFSLLLLNIIFRCS